MGPPIESGELCHPAAGGHRDPAAGGHRDPASDSSDSTATKAWELAPSNPPGATELPPT